MKKIKLLVIALISVIPIIAFGMTSYLNELINDLSLDLPSRYLTTQDKDSPQTVQYVLTLLERFHSSGDKTKIQQLIDLAVLEKWSEVVIKGLQLGYDASPKVQGELTYQDAVEAVRRTK